MKKIKNEVKATEHPPSPTKKTISFLNPDIIKRLFFEIDKSGIKMREIFDQGVSKSTLNNWKNLITEPGLFRFLQLLKILNIHPAEFFSAPGINIVQEKSGIYTNKRVPVLEEIIKSQQTELESKNMIIETQKSTIAALNQYIELTKSK